MAFVASNGLTEAGTAKTMVAGGINVQYHDVGEGDPVLLLRIRVSVGAAVAHGFITDPDFDPTGFLSMQNDSIRKIWIHPDTKSEQAEDDFLYVDDLSPLLPIFWI